MASLWNNSPQGLFIGSLKLLLYALSNQCANSEKAHLYGLEPVTKITGSFLDYCTLVT